MAYHGRGHGGRHMGGADRYGSSRRDSFSDDSDGDYLGLSDSEFSDRRTGRYRGDMGPPPRGFPPRGPGRESNYARDSMSSDGYDIGDFLTADSSDGRSTPSYSGRGPPRGAMPGTSSDYDAVPTVRDRYGRPLPGAAARDGGVRHDRGERGGYNPMRDPRGQGPRFDNRGPPNYPGRSFDSEFGSDGGLTDESSITYGDRRGPGPMGPDTGRRHGGRIPNYGDPRYNRAGERLGSRGRDPYESSGSSRQYPTPSDSESDFGSDSTSAYGPYGRDYRGRY